MKNIIIVIFTLISLLSCKDSPNIMVITGYTQGTTYSVKIWAPNKINKILLKQEINNELARIDKLMSNYRQDSTIELFNSNTDYNKPIPIAKEIIALLKISKEIYEKSNRCYDPTIKPLFKIWGFGDDKLNIPDNKKIADTLKNIGFNKLTFTEKNITKTSPDLTIDLSAIGQGYAVSQIAKILTRKNIVNYIVEIGGEMLVSGIKSNNKKWRVGVERPVPNNQQINEVITITGIRPTAIMTSGTYRHYFSKNGKKYSHILDPRSGKPVLHKSVAVTVLLDDATYADAWSTALLCLGTKEGLKVANKNNIPAIFYKIDNNNKLQRLPNNNVKQKSKFWQISK